jgi:tetratricopeptide (TPR) repeat protein
VHQRDTTDAEVSYYLGLAYEGIDREKDAAESYQQAMRLPAYRAAAKLRFAEWLAKNGDLAKAGNLLKESPGSAPEDARTAEELAAVLHALGDPSANTFAQQQLARLPLSDFLSEETGTPNLSHLAGDPYRVLNIASEYARLGLYRRAAEVLSREYPAVPTDQREPGTVAPQNHPLVVYFRGYCREKAGESGTDDYARASRLSTAFIFPNTIDDFRSLKAAIRANEKDATAHYLLGTWYFARGQTNPALTEWQQARSLNPQIPVLAASMGSSLLRQRRDFTAALQVFDEGIKNDSFNVVNYSGAVTALSLLGKPAAVRTKMLERYPDLSRMPSALLYELAFSRAEEGNYAGALDLFRNRFFEKEEGGLDVRQVWFEVKLQRAVRLARGGRCQEALASLRSLVSGVPDLPFTQGSFSSELRSARSSYLMGDSLSACGQKKEADQKFRLAAEARNAPDVVWAWAAARKLKDYDSSEWLQRLRSALSGLESRTHSDSSSAGWLYSSGVIRIALGEKEQGLASLREALLLPGNEMSDHLIHLAIEGDTPQ